MEDPIAGRYRTSSKNVSLHPNLAPRVTPQKTGEDETARRERVSTSDHAVAVAVSVALCCCVVVLCYRIVFYPSPLRVDEIVLYFISSNSLQEVSTDG